MINIKLHKSFCSLSETMSKWYGRRTEELAIPIYSSYDIRDSGYKIANVDANIYPAGFNNICPTDKETAIEVMQRFLSTHYSSKLSRILLVTEEHTQNPYYWENILTIKSLLEASGKKVLIGFPREFEQPLKLQSATGQMVEVVSAYGTSKEVKAFAPELVISNNDFSLALDEWAKTIHLPINPPRELGWYQRKKSRYFKHYNQLVNELAEIAQFDSFLLNVKTEIFEGFDLTDENSVDKLAVATDQMLASLTEEYRKRGISQEPFVFIKNNAGTYGLGVMRAQSGSELKELNYKARKKMKAAKGGREVQEVIIQEGIMSRVQADGATAEPVIYMIGCELAGGFLRAHSEKSNSESLNSPGAVYKKLCVSDLQVNLEGAPLENVYGWSARLGLLAIGLEAREMGITFDQYIKTPCSPKD